MLQWRSASNGQTGHSLGGPAKNEDAVTDLIGLMGACMSFDRNSEIFAEDEPAEYIYRVVTGAVRLTKLLSDGRRQIGAFYLPGDVFGLEAEETHSFAAEAIGPCRVLVLKRKAILEQASRDPDVARQLWAHAVGHLQRAQGHLLLLGRKSAQERIATFLTDMAERLHTTGSVDLPMSRQDIADYLGLTIETVSRTLTQLERGGVIGIPVSRRIVLRNRIILGELNDTFAA